MNVTIIHGQNHQESSYHAGRFLVNQFNDVEELHEFFLPDDLPVFRIGCYRCMHEGEEYCPHYQYLKPITQAIESSDLLIFTTPVYCFHVSAPMKTLLDHYFTWWESHRPKATMYNKQAVIISSGAGAGMKSAIQDIKTSLSHWGISNIKICGFRSQAIHWSDVNQKNKHNVQQKLIKIANSLKQPPHPQIKTKAMFMIMRVTQLKKWSACQKDYDYWQEQGWLGKKRPWKSYE